MRAGGKNFGIMNTSTQKVDPLWFFVVFRFVATFSGSVAREGEFPGDEVEHGGHVFHRPVPASLTLHGREQAVETLHEGGGQTSSPMGQDPLQMTLDHSGSSGHRLEQFSGLAPHRVHRNRPAVPSGG